MRYHEFDVVTGPSTLSPRILPPQPSDEAEPAKARPISPVWPIPNVTLPKAA